MLAIRHALTGILTVVLALGICAYLGACTSEAKESEVDSDHLTWGMDMDQAMQALESDG